MSGYNNSPYPPPPSSNQQSPYPQQHQAGASTGFPTANPYGGGGDPYAQGYGWGAPAQQPGAGYGYQGMQGGPSPPGQQQPYAGPGGFNLNTNLNAQHSPYPPSNTNSPYPPPNQGGGGGGGGGPPPPQQQWNQGQGQGQGAMTNPNPNQNQNPNAQALYGSAPAQQSGYGAGYPQQTQQQQGGPGGFSQQGQGQGQGQIYSPQNPQQQQQQGQGPPTRTGEAASFYGNTAGGPQGQGQGQGGPNDKGLFTAVALGTVAYGAYNIYQNQNQHQNQNQGGGGGGMFGAAHANMGPGAAADPRYLEGILRSCVQEQKLESFYPPSSPIFSQIAQRVAHEQSLIRLAREWCIPVETAVDLVRLSLFDVVLYLDDSGSMAFEEKGARIEDLKLVLRRSAFAASLFDTDGVQVRFMNSRIESAISSEQQALDLIQRVEFNGMTPLGTSLEKKVLDPLVLHPAKRGGLRKPVLVVAITDGAPSGEDRHKIVSVMKHARKDLSKTRYGPDAISYQLAQVGNDRAARAFLEEIDVHPEVGSYVDVTSNFENEADNCRRGRNPINLTPELWLIKLLLGGISSAYDFKDE